VLIRVGAAGACHSDLHLMDAPAEVLAAFPVPFTFGHENAGWVEALGVGVDGFESGEPVAVYGIIGCGQCAACLRGRDNACRNVAPSGVGIGRDGGMAPYLSVPARQLIPIGDLDVTQGAPDRRRPHSLPRDRAQSRSARPGSTCVVVGVGGLGHMAIQILAATTTARIIAIDVQE